MNNRISFDQDSLINWFYENRSLFGLKIVEFSWPKTSGIPCFDFESKICLDGREWLGRGTSRDPKTALTISLHEVIERYVCGVNCLVSTNGVATHHSLDQSFTFAEAELYERHLVLKSLSQKKGLAEIEITDLILSKYRDRGISFNLYKTSKLNHLESYILLVKLAGLNQDLGGLIYTSSVHGEGLFLTAIRNIEAIIDGNNFKISNYYNPIQLKELINHMNIVEYPVEEITSIQMNSEVLKSELFFPAITTRVWSEEMCNINLNISINPYAEK
jgi:hypothetical protein